MLQSSYDSAYVFCGLHNLNSTDSIEAVMMLPLGQRPAAHRHLRWLPPGAGRGGRRGVHRHLRAICGRVPLA
eukprot:6935716-Pyramimonas_sp.AAC.3